MAYGADRKARQVDTLIANGCESVCVFFINGYANDENERRAVEWVRTVSTYNIGEMKDTLEDALSTEYDGLKVIIAEGECMLNKQRRIKPQIKVR